MITRLQHIIIINVLIIIQSNATDWYRNDEMLTLYEAMTKISAESLYTDAKRVIPSDIIKNHIYKIDEYGDYFTKEEYKAFQEILVNEYAGIGMILYQEKRNEKILCIPTTDQLSQKGIVQYDELVSVDGRYVEEKNVYLVSSWIRGRKNSSVTLSLKKSSGEIKTITMKRTEQEFHSVQRIIDNNTAMIQIIRFVSETPNELLRILQQWPKNIPIVIDLRGNGGGDFFAAVKSADLLLPKKSLIATMETTKLSTDYYASSPDLIQGRPVFILQDEHTASAAEVFMAALTQNNRVESIGKRSLGKGVAQKFIPLDNGDALLLTYGKIITPNGKSYHKLGLEPTSNLSLEALLEMTNETNIF